MYLRRKRTCTNVRETCRIKFIIKIGFNKNEIPQIKILTTSPTRLTKCFMEIKTSR